MVQKIGLLLLMNFIQFIDLKSALESNADKGKKRLILNVDTTTILTRKYRNEPGQ